MALSLKEKTAKGLLWGGLSNGIQQLLNLFFGIFLARKLTPDDYGMVGMLTIFSLIAASLQESGFTTALANKKVIQHKDYNAVFWFNLGLSITIYIILFFAAPFIADFYNEPELEILARYSFLSFVISSLGTAQNAYLFCNLMTKQKGIAIILGIFISGITGICLAYNGYAYWGIATQNLTYVTVITFCYWYFSPWRPTFHFDFSPLKSMFSFSNRILLTNIFSHINNNFLSVILGKFYTDAAVGYFNQANKWNYMGHQLITGMVSGVAQPVLAQVSDDRERQLRVFRKMLRFTSFLSFPAMLGLSLAAPEIIVIAITDKWSESAWMLQILCVSGAFIPLVYLFSSLVLSKGKSYIYMWNTIVQSLVQLALMLLFSDYGIYTMVVVYVSVHVSWLFVWYCLVRHEIGLSFWDMIKDIFPFAIVALLVMFSVYNLTVEIENIYVRLVAKIFCAVLFYAGLMAVLGGQTFKECMGYIFKRGKVN
ncbi:MAG: lipopolysaccharide biosynthesis protein [Bacteroidaceae bacterium]|nr:lipopolysaccharide biosynthesis protein [Bacteroidaceae bacterium]